MTVDRSDPKPGLKLSTMRFPVRWGELDAQGHVNNTVYLRYFEESRVLWGETLGLHLDGKGEGMILLKSSVTYRKQVNYPANIDVALFVGKIGQSSFSLIQTLTVEGDTLPAAVGEFVIVWFNYETDKSLPIPAAVRAVLEGKGPVN